MLIVQKFSAKLAFCHEETETFFTRYCWVHYRWLIVICSSVWCDVPEYGACHLTCKWMIVTNGKLIIL